MGQTIELGCRCGEIVGAARDVSEETINRGVCYCDDCQAYLHQLGRADLLDEHGGTDIVQVCPDTVTFERGAERIVCLRLTDRGMYRWYAGCCNTPLGNTLSAAAPLPFIGMLQEVFRGTPNAATRDAAFGPSRGAMMAKFAVGTLPEGTKAFPALRLVALLGRLLRWKFTGRSWPHPFFDQGTGQPKYPVTILTTAEREALRASCGPDLQR